MACHNRKDKTIKCLESLFAAKPANWDLRIYLVDDGSSDGTSEAVRKFDPGIKIIKGDGNWFWAHSMYQAEMAIDQPHDAILWINDDVILNTESLSTMASYLATHPFAILIGQFKASLNNKLTYGGYQKYDRHPFHFRHVHAETTVKLVETFNGNLVLIPKVISDIVGKIDGDFAHAYADIDYGLRARVNDIEMYVLPGFSGICDPNNEPMLNNLIDEFRLLLSKKNSPLGSQTRFLKITSLAT